MHANLIQIGNSRGVRLSKTVIEAAGLQDSLDLEVRDGAVVIRAARSVRSGWADAALACRNAGDDALEDWDAAAGDGDLS
ncbi:MAG: AbrB/MazE/SpoVT family DNA-binding domain-containing protein [Phycisphaerales bacterium]|jgi:antitoxin MazE|nr:AbrB/MazE/SpoVT family DNA-binding domain-containing protein [Phycisphaerales bacterium]